MKDIVEIPFDAYDSAYAAWIIGIYGKAMNGAEEFKKFDNHLGIQLDLSLDSTDDECYIFYIVDKKKFFLAKIRYGF